MGKGMVFDRTPHCYLTFYQILRLRDHLLPDQKETRAHAFLFQKIQHLIRNTGSRSVIKCQSHLLFSHCISSHNNVAGCVNPCNSL